MKLPEGILRQFVFLCVMEEPISQLVPHVCPSCGGHLETDESRKHMICRSCGNTYDYDYFAEENLLKAADKALAHKDFSAAKDMYTFMLDKEPSNLKALKGLLLANNNVVRSYDITRKIKDGTFSIAAFDLEKYRSSLDSEAKGFFEKTDKVLSLYKEYVPLKKALKKLEDEAGDTEPEYIGAGNGIFYYASGETLKKTVLIFSIVLVGLLIFVLVFGTTGFASTGFISFLIVVMIAIAIVIFAALLEMLSKKKEKKLSDDPEANKLRSRIEETKGEMDRVINDINDVLKELK